MFYKGLKKMVIVAIFAVALPTNAKDTITQSDDPNEAVNNQGAIVLQSAAQTLPNATALSVEPLPASSEQPAFFDSNHIVVRTAGRWANYHKTVNHWGSKNISSAEELEQAMIEFASYDGVNFAPGWMAVSALIALQTPEYIKGVRHWEKEYGRELTLQRIHQNTMASMQFPGAEKAKMAILRAASSDSAQILLIGDLFKEQAYSMQKEPWANKKQGGKHLRLSAIRMSPNSPTKLDHELLQALAAPGVSSLEKPFHSETAKSSFLSALKLGPRSAWANQGTGLSEPQLAPGRDATIARILSVTALMVLNEDQSHPNFQSWLDDIELRECVDWSRVHLNQCVAAGHFVFESSFCIAEHQLKDSGKCLSDIVSK